MSGPARFIFRLENGEIVIGPVQGAGGFASKAMMMAAKRQASEDYRMCLYEPQAGHVAVFPEYTYAGNGTRRVVPISAWLSSRTPLSKETKPKH